MTLTARQTQNQYLAICRMHPDYCTGWQLIFSSRTTDNGAVNGSTLTDDTRDSGGANTYNGKYWVRCTSGNNKGLWKRVVHDDGSGTLTFEGVSDSDGFPNQVVNNDTYELWLSPEPVVIVTSSASAANVADSARDEPSDYWDGYYLIPITGSNRGEKGYCSAFLTGTGTFTIAAGGFSSALSVGDICVLRAFVDVTNVSDGLTHAFNPRPMTRLNGQKPDGSVGVKGGTFGFDARAQCGVVTSDILAPPPLGGAIMACGFYEFKNGVDAGDALESGSTTTGLEVGTGSWEDWTIGGMVSVEGEKAFITGCTDGGGAADTVTVTPALGLAPDAAAHVYQTWNYRRNHRSDHGDYSALLIEREVDGVRTIMTGCKGNFTMAGEEELSLSFEFQVDHWIREVQPTCANYLGDAYSTQNPVIASERRCYFGSTEMDLGAISLSLNNEVAPRKVQGSYGINGRAGYGHNTCNPGATFRRLLAVVSGEHLPADEEWLSRTTIDFMVMWGTEPQAGIGVRMPDARLVADAKPEDDEGAQVTPYVLEALHPGTTTDPDSTVVKIPDIIISFG